MDGINTVLGGKDNISFGMNDNDGNVSIRNPIRDGGRRSIDVIILVRCWLTLSSLS